jgi:radical SAM protein with 4Fe4S-binding SPASM domain
MTVLPRQKAYRIRSVECGIGEYRDSIPVCRGNRGMVAIAANGNVFPCLQMSGYYEAKNDILGNVKKDGLQPLLQAGKYLSEVCTTVGTLAEKNETCGKCPYFKHCVGGCRAIALTLTGDKLGVDLSKCLFYKKGYYEKTVSIMGDWVNHSEIQISKN